MCARVQVRRVRLCTSIDCEEYSTARRAAPLTRAPLDPRGVRFLFSSLARVASGRRLNHRGFAGASSSVSSSMSVAARVHRLRDSDAVDDTVGLGRANPSSLSLDEDSAIISIGERPRGFVLGVRLASTSSPVVVGVATEDCLERERSNASALLKLSSPRGVLAPDAYGNPDRSDDSPDGVPGVRSPKKSPPPRMGESASRSSPPRDARARRHFPAAPRRRPRRVARSSPLETIRASATVGRRRDRRLGRRRRRRR